MAFSHTAATDQQIISHSLRLALIASQVRRAWHSGAIDADEAMGVLDRAINEICSSRAMAWDQPRGGPFVTAHGESPTPEKSS
jgi:hypothetical protein